jgi:Flp pilus assembly protein TadD
MRACVLSLALCLLSAIGCATSKPTPTYQTLSDQVSQRSEAAKKANEQGMLYAQSNELEKAEASFREALQADIGYAAAHNNLGLVLLYKIDFYEVTMEFRFASKLNPHAVEPVLNLARLYQAVGWTKEAERESASAARLRQAGGPGRKYAQGTKLDAETSTSPEGTRRTDEQRERASLIGKGEQE